MTIEGFIKSLELAKETYPNLKFRDIHFFVEVNNEWKEFMPFIFDIREDGCYDAHIVLKPY